MTTIKTSDPLSVSYTLIYPHQFCNSLTFIFSILYIKYAIYSCSLSTWEAFILNFCRKFVHIKDLIWLLNWMIRMWSNLKMKAPIPMWCLFYWIILLCFRKQEKRGEPNWNAFGRLTNLFSYNRVLQDKINFSLCVLGWPWTFLVALWLELRPIPVVHYAKISCSSAQNFWYLSLWYLLLVNN